MEKTKQKKKSLEEAIYVSWEESKRGWGVRPDGCSLHLTKEDSKIFEREYWDGMPNDVPHEYSRPAGRPVKVYVDKTLYRKIKKSDNGIRFWRFQEGEIVKNKQLVYGSERSGWVSS